MENEKQLTQQDLDSILSYVKHLEGQVGELKTTLITVVQQRNSAMNKLKELGNQWSGRVVESRTMDIDYEIEHQQMEQYGEKKQF